MQQALCPFCFAEGFSGTCRGCGYQSAPGIPGVLPAMSRLADHYLIGAVIGKGGFGITYSGLDLRNSRRVAIKECFPNGIFTRDPDSAEVLSLVQDDTAVYSLERFLDEAKTLHELRGCPGIVQVIDYIQQNHTAYLVMEFVEGKSLWRVAAQYGGRLPYRIAMHTMLLVARSMAVVHRQGLLHRDISPDNILISGSDTVTLIDFGAAREYVGKRNLTVILKIGYSPPEQASSKGKQGCWTDVYALASSIYAVMGGEKAPDAMMRLGGSPLQPLYGRVPGFPQQMDAVFERAMQLSCEGRYQTMDELANAILAADPTLESPAGKTGPEREVGQGQPLLTVVEGPLKGLCFHLEPERRYTVGRKQQSGFLQLPGAEEVSRAHLLIRYDAQSAFFIVTDNHSRNGTFYENGHRLEPMQDYAVAPGGRFYPSSPQYLLEVGLT